MKVALKYKGDVKSMVLGNRMKKIQKIFLRTSIATALLLLVWILFFVLQADIREKNDIKKLVDDDYNLMFQVDSVEITERRIILTGWVFRIGVNSVERDMEILLYDMDGKIQYSNTEDMIRDDVNQYFLCEYDYSKSGFSASFKIDKKDFKKKDYEILIEDKIEDKIYKTNIFLNNDKVMYVNPKIFKSLDVNGTDLEKIVNEGVLRMYRPEIGMYVYQHEKSLYWIAEPKYPFEVDNADIEYLTYTTQPWNNIVDGKEKQVRDLHFYFEKDELQEFDTGIYRVCKKNIPEDYAVFKVQTGVWTPTDGWYWEHQFRLIIE